MHALVTHSRKDGKSSYIPAGKIGKTTRMPIAPASAEAAVVEAQVDISSLLRAVGSPGEGRRS
jgi:hypothetical protein